MRNKLIKFYKLKKAYIKEQLEKLKNPNVEILSETMLIIARYTMIIYTIIMFIIFAITGGYKNQVEMSKNGSMWDIFSTNVRDTFLTNSFLIGFIWLLFVVYFIAMLLVGVQEYTGKKRQVLIITLLLSTLGVICPLIIMWLLFYPLLLGLYTVGTQYLEMLYTPLAYLLLLYGGIVLVSIIISTVFIMLKKKCRGMLFTLLIHIIVIFLIMPLIMLIIENILGIGLLFIIVTIVFGLMGVFFNSEPTRELKTGVIRDKYGIEKEITYFEEE